MTKIVDGRKAEITDKGRRYSTYRDFAEKHGYPEAAAPSDAKDSREKPENGDIVTLLTSGPHLTGYPGATLWVVEAANGERHIINEVGLRILTAEVRGVTLLPDESLSGTLHEYREVKREASVGELVTFSGASAGITPNKPYTVIGRDNSGAKFRDDDGDMRWDSHITDAGFSSAVLEPTEILVINSERFRMVDRKATVGERVIVTKPESDGLGSYSVGEHGVVTGGRGWVDDDVHVDFGGKTKFIGPSARNSEYAVLEPVESAAPTPEPALLSAQPAESQAAANIVSLALRLTQAEAKITALERKVASGPVDKSERAALPSFAYTMYRKAGAISAKTPQMIRDEIVERAKADVTTLENTYRANRDGHSVSFWPKACAKDGYLPCHTVAYVINCDKRTVVALIQYDDGGGVAYRGIAKCAPGETFNSAIGKAIALHRALGIVVPAEYLNAPGPEIVRDGDVVRYNESSRGALTVREVAQNTSVETFLSTAQDHFDNLTVLDDSRDEDGGHSAASSALKGAA